MTTLHVHPVERRSIAVLRAPRRIRPNLFAVSFGLAGLAQTWTVAERVAPVPSAVTAVLWALAATVWLITLAYYARWVRSAARLRVELADHIFGPFVSVPTIVGLLVSGGLRPYAAIPAHLLFFGSLAAALLLAGRLLAMWALDDTPATQWHPGYYLPSVGAPLVGAAQAVGFGYVSLARLLFGFGVISWILIGGILLHHLIGQQRLPQALTPTLAILVAPPVVAGNAWFAINGGRVDGIAFGLAGYSVLMVTVQVSLVREYRTVPFGPGWWSYSFPAAATVTNALLWLEVEHTQHAAVWAAVLLALVTAAIAALAVRTVLAMARRTFLPDAR